MLVPESGGTNAAVSSKSRRVSESAATSTLSSVTAFRQHRYINLRLASGDPLIKVFMVVPRFRGHPLLISGKAGGVFNWDDSTILYANERRDEELSSRISPRRALHSVRGSRIIHHASREIWHAFGSERWQQMKLAVLDDRAHRIMCALIRD